MLQLRSFRLALAAPFAVATVIGTAQMNAENLQPVFAQEASGRFDCEKLRLIPIMGNDAYRDAYKDMGELVPMNKALQDGRLKVKEQEGGATVNTLQVENTSKDTIYLMQGEVVVGGKQDRMLAQDVIVLPGATLSIGAFCVEHGRWQAGSTGHEFKGTIGVVGQKARKAAAVEKEQTRVWEEVAKDIKKNETDTRSGSYAHLMQDREFQADRQRYREKLLGLPAANSHVVGVIAISGDKVVGCDVFATSALFAQAFPQLVDAYIAEALNNGKAVTMTDAQVAEYFAKLFAEEDGLEKRTEGSGYLFKSNGRKYRLSKF
ncbi:MAG: hypothetical protein IPK70_14990 [Flavobacteriales bacterium]|jgi:hypothetical protein|nr:hypothetical protein [Flavobacteriales bacterium]